jgi:hypothetical protein
LHLYDLITLNGTEEKKEREKETEDAVNKWMQFIQNANKWMELIGDKTNNRHAILVTPKTIVGNSDKYSHGRFK